MFDFIGCGSAFNTRLGNNSAYMKFDDTLFMIDCGSANFDRIKRANLLDGVKRIDVLITHLHPDHIGSLGDLIFHTYYNMQPMFQVKLRVLVPKQLLNRVQGILRWQGVTDEKYDVQEIRTFYTTDYDLMITPVKVEHARELDCFGYILDMADTSIYYSGDANMIPHHILKWIGLEVFDYFYQDTCKADYDGNVHLSLRKLCELIPQEHRHKVYCMHLDEQFDADEARGLGFNVVSTSL